MITKILTACGISVFVYLILRWIAPDWTPPGFLLPAMAICFFGIIKGE